MINEHEGAYCTVEAVLVMPIVILFISIMIFMSFYAYDRSMLEHSAYKAALVGASGHYDTSKEATERAKNEAALLTENKVFAVKDLTHSVTADWNSVTVTYNCVVNMPFKPLIGEFISGFSDDYMTFSVTKTAPRLKPVRTIRHFKLANNLLDNTEEEDE
jgi:uncharacterized protein with FMN-binding domain